MENITITLARAEEATLLSALADEIWHEHYGTFLRGDQIDYMLDKFQSAQAIARDIGQNGYLYYLAYAQGEAAGYCAIHPQEEQGSVFLSKIYVKKEWRRRGIASRFLNTVLEEARKRGCQKVWLTVNKYNAGSIAAYQRLGFTVEDAMVTDIGGGFVMDDYKMSRPVS